MAPRGLITILLFFSIPEKLVQPDFNRGILLLVILASSIMMAISLIRYRRSSARSEVQDSPENGLKIGQEVPLDPAGGSESAPDQEPSNLAEDS
jgi:hypothetical protein